jgi:tRNA/rRNA methyltransferase
MAFWIYIVKCSDGSYYTGHTDDLERRLAAHQSGGFKGYTSSKRPVQLMYTQEFPTRLEALEHERQVKRWSRVKKRALTRRDWEEISRLAKSKPS